MTSNSKIGALAMITALLGGTAGALVTRTSNTNKTLPAISQVAAPLTESAPQAAAQPQPADDGAQFESSISSSDKLYRDGFAEGFQAAREESLNASPEAQAVPSQQAATPSRVVYRTVRPRYSNAPQTSQSYGNYQQPAKRSFWSKHRDKLTVAAGAGGGAIVGGLIGGKKGAAIGALAGGGGSALYTYKLRKRNQRY